MKPTAAFLFGLLVLAPAFAQEPGSASSAVTKAKPKVNGTSFDGQPAPNSPDRAAQISTRPAAPVPRVMKLDDYLGDLAASLTLTEDEKTGIKNAYLADGPATQQALDDAALSPLQQNDRISELRNARNARIGALLQSSAREQEFLAMEARYRVALLDLAASGGLSAPPPAAAPAKTNPAQAVPSAPSPAKTE